MAAFNNKRRVMLWIVVFLLAITFGWAAYMKLFTPFDELAEMWPWTRDHPALVKVTGALDLMAVIGLVTPGLTRYAAYGVIGLMIAACIFHISRGEGSQIGFNVFVALAAGFVAWARRG